MNIFFAKHLLGDQYSEEKGDFIASLLQSAREGHFCLKSPNAPTLPPIPEIVKDKDRYYLKKNWVYETTIMEQIQRLRASPITSLATPPEHLNAEQKEAIRQMLNQSFSILCGGPGTGKTYTAALFVSLLAKTPSYRVVVTAPTGKAALHLHAKVLSENPHIKCEVSTLHRLLKLKPGETNLFSSRRIDADLILVDEASMMDVSLFAHLLEAVGDQTRLVLLGDPNQLPPVEVGSLFTECAEQFGIFLEKCMRTEDPHLQASAKAILEGDEDAFFASVCISESFVDSLVDFFSKFHETTRSQCLETRAIWS